MNTNIPSQSRTLIDMVETYGAHNYQPLPIVLDRGKGSKVWDVEGREYLDFLSCYSALNFGHQNPQLTETLIQQMSKLSLCSRAFYTEEFSLFCKELAQFTGLDMVLAMNSGAEAVETAIKLARKWGYQKRGIAEGKANIVTFENNFHGRTVTIVSFSSDDEYRKDFGPFTPGFEIVKFGDVEAVEKAIDSDTVAILVEPIQAEAGILLPPEGFLKRLRELCDRHRILLILDEIQTGLGRTGKNFCFQHDSVLPDLLVLGKSLGGGLLPISAVVGRRDVMEVVRPGQHGSTFGGNPLASAVGRKVIQMLSDGALSERAMRLGKKAIDVLNEKKLPHVKEIRGQGALIGIELEVASGGARRYCERIAERGVLCKETHGYVIRIAPPLTIDEKDLLSGVRTIVEVIHELA